MFIRLATGLKGTKMDAMMVKSGKIRTETRRLWSGQIRINFFMRRDILQSVSLNLPQVVTGDNRNTVVDVVVVIVVIGVGDVLHKTLREQQSQNFISTLTKDFDQNCFYKRRFSRFDSLSNAIKIFGVHRVLL